MSRNGSKHPLRGRSHYREHHPGGSVPMMSLDELRKLHCRRVQMQGHPWPTDFSEGLTQRKPFGIAGTEFVIIGGIPVETARPRGKAGRDFEL